MRFGCEQRAGFLVGFEHDQLSAVAASMYHPHFSSASILLVQEDFTYTFKTVDQRYNPACTLPYGPDIKAYKHYAMGLTDD